MPIVITVGTLFVIADIANHVLETIVLPMKHRGAIETLRQTQVGIVLQQHELTALQRVDIDDHTLGELLVRGVRQHSLYVREPDCHG